MNLREFRRAGHVPTLFSAFLYFDISFMIWVALGALANSIVADFGLSDAQKGLMVAVPLLGGAMLRLVLGLLTDRIGARRTGLLGLTLTVIPVLLGWLWADSFPKILLVGLLLGVAGASFAVALPLASRWYPPRYQGLALGIAGAGNSGTALATFFGPRLAESLGWHAVFGLALIPLMLTFIVYAVCAKDSPEQPAPKPLSAYFTLLRERDAWWFCFFYAVTFGGFVGLAASLPIYFTDRFGLTPVMAGYGTAACVFAGSLVRPLGGALADRIGGVKTLTGVFLVAAIALIGVSAAPTVASAMSLFVLAMLALGTGNGAVFQLVPQRFAAEIGVMTGLVGMAGGIGGFYLASSLGVAKQLTGSFAPGFLIFAGLAVVACLALTWVKHVWRGSWGAGTGVRI